MGREALQDPGRFWLAMFEIKGPLLLRLIYLYWTHGPDVHDYVSVSIFNGMQCSSFRSGAQPESQYKHRRQQLP